MDFFAQSLDVKEVYLIHPHPQTLLPALRHSAKFGANTVIVFHLWKSLHTSHVILKGGHLLAAAENVTICYPNFIGGELAPAFQGVRHFPTLIFNFKFVAGQSVEEQFQNRLDRCLFGSCYVCKL